MYSSYGKRLELNFPAILGGRAKGGSYEVGFMVSVPQFHTVDITPKSIMIKRLNQSRYRPGVAQRVPGN